MASPLIGRATCPECGFTGAHVKRSERCLYRYCPECGSQYHAKTARQQELLTAKMRPEGSPTPTPTQGEGVGGEGVEQATPAPTQPAPTRRRGLFA